MGGRPASSERIWMFGFPSVVFRRGGIMVLKVQGILAITQSAPDSDESHPEESPNYTGSNYLRSRHVVG